MKYEKIVTDILASIGGEQNINTVIHCATRLRFTLIDDSKVDDKVIAKIPEILSAVRSGGQYQLVIGSDVDKVFKELSKSMSGKRPTNAKQPKKSIVNTVLSTITGSITPAISLLAGCGMGKVLLLVLTMTNVLSETSQTYLMLKFIFDAGFYFMPAFIGFSSAKMFGANEYLGAFLGLCLVHPTWNGIAGGEEAFSFLGVNVPLVKYTSTLVPVLMSVWIMSYIERFVNKVVPEMIKVFAVPMLVALISVPLSFIVIAPIGDIISSFVADGSMFLYDKVGLLAIPALAALYPWLVSIGIHKALSPISIDLVATQGFDPVIRVVALCSNMSQSAASLAVSFKTKNKKLKSLAFSSALTGYLGGITEPAMYGVNLKLKRPMYASMIGAAVAGLFAGLLKLKAFIYVTPGLLSMAMWISKEENFVVGALITLVIASVVTFVATLILGFDDSEFYDEDEANVFAVNDHDALLSSTHSIALASPLDGTVIIQENISDRAFASGIIGKGVGVKPSSNSIYAPCDATVTALFDSKHAIGLTDDNGVEILIHVGVDTSSMMGEGFEVLTNKGDKVKKGQLLMTFNTELINKAGHDDTVIIVITNSNDYMDVIETKKERVSSQDDLLTVIV